MYIYVIFKHPAKIWMSLVYNNRRSSPAWGCCALCSVLCVACFWLVSLIDTKG